MTQRYRLARKGDSIPMPDRGGAFFTSDPEGQALDPTNPFHARLIADGDVKLIEPEPEAERTDPPARANGSTAKPSGDK